MRVPWYLMAKGKGGGGYKTASGPIVSVNDALAAPLRSLLVNIDPVQSGSGDPSPDNVRPISGWTEAKVWRTGKNLLPIQTITNNGSTYFIGDSSTYFPFKAGTYTASNVGTAAYMYWRKKGTSDNNVIHAAHANSGTFTLTEDCEIRFWFYTNVADASFTDIQIELSSIPTPYSPYSGNQYTIQLGDTYYGGTLDVLNGVLTVDRAYWTKNTSTMNNPSAYPGWRASGLKALGYSGDGVVRDAVMNIGTVFSFNCNGTNDVLFLSTSYYGKTQEEWIALAMDVQILVPLATPITIPLTPTEISTLQGQNTLWADSGDVTVEYLSAGGADPDLMKLAVAFMGRK